MKKATSIFITILISISITGFSFTLITNPFPQSQYLKTYKSVKKPITADVKVNNERDRELRKLEEFSKITTLISGNIFYTQGNEHRVEIDANEEVQLNIVTKVKDGKLIIKFKNKKETKGDINIYITSKNLVSVSTIGSGDFMSEEKVKTEELQLSIAGSGDITFKNLYAEEIITEIAGSGDIEISGKGKTKELTINIAGSGDITAEKLLVKEAEINIAGSGDCLVNVTDEIEINIVGSGDVTYLGEPEIESNIIGSGEIRREK